MIFLHPILGELEEGLCFINATLKLHFASQKHLLSRDARLRQPHGVHHEGPRPRERFEPPGEVAAIDALQIAIGGGV